MLCFFISCTCKVNLIGAQVIQPTDLLVHEMIVSSHCLVKSGTRYKLNSSHACCSVMSRQRQAVKQTFASKIQFNCQTIWDILWEIGLHIDKARGGGGRGGEELGAYMYASSLSIDSKDSHSKGQESPINLTHVLGLQKSC